MMIMEDYIHIDQHAEEVAALQGIIDDREQEIKDILFDFDYYEGVLIQAIKLLQAAPRTEEVETFFIDNAWLVSDLTKEK
jgi:hypothetical protein